MPLVLVVPVARFLVYSVVLDVHAYSVVCVLETALTYLWAILYFSHNQSKQCQ